MTMQCSHTGHCWIWRRIAGATAATVQEVVCTRRSQGGRLLLLGGSVARGLDSAGDSGGIFGDSIHTVQERGSIVEDVRRDVKERTDV